MNRGGRIVLGVAAGAALLAGAGIWFWPRPVRLLVDYKMPGNPGPKIIAAKAAGIERRERALNETVWAKEMRAEEYGRVFENFWDSLNAATNKTAAAQELKFGELILGQWDLTERLPHQIEIFHSTPRRAVVAGEAWRAFVEKQAIDGWRLMQVEFRHNQFDLETNGSPAKSRFYFSAHLTNAIAPGRVAIDGDLLVEWRRGQTNQEPQIARMDATGLEIKFRSGPPAFVPVLEEAFETPDLSASIEPLNVYDLDGDGVPEIILPTLNKVFRRKGGEYEAGNLYPTQRLQILAGLFADFDGDGVADFLFAEFDGLFLLKGGAGGKFETKARLVAEGLGKLGGPRALTCGDIDGDGDLDVFVGQYKGPYVGGSFPTPYYDANDGYPAYLLVNDGRGNFTDATEAAGIGEKRFRRVYGASFVDLDGDGALDLAVTSDFAGVDVYRGDGRGHFGDKTTEWLGEAHAFGMSHAFADFDRDGRLDFLVGGMTSPTAERLEHLGLNRPSSFLDVKKRASMVFGNRLFFGKEGGGFAQGAGNLSMVRSGWSWGIAAADFDNDGWDDIYVANGMESGRTVRDYDSEFWLHDIFVANSKADPVMATYFTVRGGATRGAGMSYRGFDKNRLYLNRGGREFVDVAHLLGVASEEDCRNLVAADLDGDGKVDLVFTTVESKPPFKQRLHVYRNVLPETGNWIGFSFREEPGRLSPIGVKMVLRAGGSARTRQLVTGDSFRSQHPMCARFGLGSVTSVESVEMIWPGGAKVRVAGPEINRLNAIQAPMH